MYPVLREYPTLVFIIFSFFCIHVAIVSVWLFAKLTVRFLVLLGKIPK